MHTLSVLSKGGRDAHHTPQPHTQPHTPAAYVLAKWQTITFIMNILRCGSARAKCIAEKVGGLVERKTSQVPGAGWSRPAKRTKFRAVQPLRKRGHKTFGCKATEHDTLTLILGRRTQPRCYTCKRLPGRDALCSCYCCCFSCFVCNSNAIKLASEQIMAAKWAKLNSAARAQN